MKYNNIKNEYDYQKNMQKQYKVSTSAILSIIFASFGIISAIETLSLFLNGHTGEMSFLFGIVYLALPTAALAIATGIAGLKNPEKWMAIVGLTVGIGSAIIDMVVLVLHCYIG